MKNRLWVLQVPMVIAFCAAYWIVDLASVGGLRSGLLRNSIYPVLARVGAVTTDFKFKARGPRPIKNKIVVVEIDNWSIEDYGRWPWHRDQLAQLIERIFDLGAKAVGLDMILAEPDRRVPLELEKELGKRGMGELLQRYETDPVLAKTLALHRDKVVLAWGTESPCQPLYAAPEECPVLHPGALATHPPEMARFTFGRVEGLKSVPITQTPILSAVTVLASQPDFANAVTRQGFLNVEPDGDGYIRRSSLVVLVGGRPYPSLALEMARSALGAPALEVSFAGGKVKRVGFAGIQDPVPTSDLGAVEINYRGPDHYFPYVSAHELLEGKSILEDPLNLKLKGKAVRDLLDQAVVLVGLSALGAYDMRSFPFAANVPGVDGHAQILDNLLSRDPLVPLGGTFGAWFVLFLMSFGALAFAYVTQRLEAVPALGLFLAVLVVSLVVDVTVCFGWLNRNYSTGYYYLELLLLFGATLAGKYVLEERNKKFIRGAFSKYVAPAVVDSILKDPEKLALGGERKELTVLFSDIRQFTTFSEQMDARTLSAFLNDYLGIMTRIVFNNQGTLDKYIGDAVMAFWGAPLDQVHHASYALVAARQMLEALKENHGRFLQTYGIDVRIGIGVNSGIISVGNMGSEQSFEYTVIGDHVNLASRLEGLTKHYKVDALTSRYALDCIQKVGGELPPHRVLDRVVVKGKKTIVELVELLHGTPSPEDKERLQAFEEARGLYLARDFRGAKARFEDLGPGPGEVFAQRCELWLRSPPSEGWQGEWIMEEK